MSSPERSLSGSKRAVTTAPLRVAALLLDLDGVLVDSFAAWHKVLNRALAERGRPPIPESQMRASWGQGIQEDSRFYFGGEPIDSLAATYDRLFPECIDRIAVMPGADQTLAQLAGNGIRLAVVTNTPRELALRILATTGLRSHFAAVAAGDEVTAGKPDPALLHLAAARLSVSLAECLFVGDTEVDLEAGRRAPCRTAGFRIDADLRIENLPELLDLVRLTRGFRGPGM